MVERKETAADIVVNVGEEQIAVEQLSFSKEIEIDQIYGTSNVIPSGYGITQMSYSGNMSIKGNTKELNDKFFDSNGVPRLLDSISVTHLDGGSTSFDSVLLINEGYEVNSGETVESSYDWIAMSKDEDTNPQN